MRLHVQTQPHPHIANVNAHARRCMQKESGFWQEHLPQKYQTEVIAPLAFRRYRDYEMPAERYVGEDEDGAPCFIAHRFGLFEPRSDDGEAFYTVLAYGESLAAWRLRDDRWLIWREIQSEAGDGEARSFYCLAQEMPR